MNKQTDKITELISTAKKALQENDVETAVNSDATLAQYLKSSSAAIESQTKIHANQYDFIIKYRANTIIKEIVLVLLSLYLFSLTPTASGMMLWVLYGVAGLTGWGAIKSIARTSGPLRMLSAEEQSIIQEKRHIQQTYQNMSLINQYQLETLDKMSEMYKQYEDRYREQYQGLGSLFENMNKQESSDEDEDDEEETHS